MFKCKKVIKNNLILKMLSLCLCLSLCVTSFTGCGITDYFSDVKNKIFGTDEKKGGSGGAVAKDRYEIPVEDASEKAIKFVENMTIEQKVGQLFSVNLELLAPSSGDYYEHRRINDEMKESLLKYKVGGVILFSRNIYRRKQTIKLIKRLQNNSEIPMFIMVDEEGGEVQRIGSNPDMKTTSFRTPEEIGENEDTDYTYEMGNIIAKDIDDLGFNVNLAPVADVNTSEFNYEIGSRSFGSDPDKVSEFVVNFVKGTHDANVCATLKHFPGQGSSSGDTHVQSVNIDSDISELRDNDFKPFIAGIEELVDFIMISHISVSKVTESKEPASLSELIMRTILREELGYNGIIITDAFDMSSITEYYDAGDAAVTSIKNGSDIVLMPENLDEAYNAVLDAVESGKITEEELDEKILRIITTKYKRGIIE
ncbi:MAG: glycoside hydrolase family 3 protein [Lachnospiraceae bacterium]|nr:glycoside hydrolase family 3 protein [Lachnospiraceae bacterium]